LSFPDWLAFSRVILVPVIMGLTHSPLEHRFVIAGGLFAFAAATDFFDGYLARRWKSESVLGAFLDTTADKLLVTGALLALLTVNRVSMWAALVIMMREFVVMALRGLVALSGGLIRPSTWGKVKAFAQFIAIGFAFIRCGPEFLGMYLDQWLMWIAVILTIASGWQYVASYWDHMMGRAKGKVSQ